MEERRRNLLRLQEKCFCTGRVGLGILGSCESSWSWISIEVFKFDRVLSEGDGNNGGGDTRRSRAEHEQVHVCRRVFRTDTGVAA